MKNTIKKIKIYGLRTSLIYAFSELRNKFFLNLFKKTYSQSEEDLIIDKLLNYKKYGFYVDIGAYDPYRFSNTMHFYKKGWKGINIEPDINNYKKFLNNRSRDINLNIGIGDKHNSLTFYQFLPDTISTFSKSEVEMYIKMGFQFVSKEKIIIERLDKILEKYCQNREIDFMSIDVEGFEMSVLKSNDWKKFIPKIICIESSDWNMFKPGVYNRDKGIEKEESFLRNHGYKKVYTTGCNSIFINSNV